MLIFCQNFLSIRQKDNFLTIYPAHRLRFCPAQRTKVAGPALGGSHLGAGLVFPRKPRQRVGQRQRRFSEQGQRFPARAQQVQIGRQRRGLGGVAKRRIHRQPPHSRPGVAHGSQGVQQSGQLLCQQHRIGGQGDPADAGGRFESSNQLRHVLFLKDKAHTLALMKQHAAILAPKFHAVLDALDKEIAPLGIAGYKRPVGGYFISVDVMPGCAKRTLALCKEAGVTMTGAGATFPYGKDPQDSNIRIAPSLPPVAELEQAIAVFCTSLNLAALEKLGV